MQKNEWEKTMAELMRTSAASYDRIANQSKQIAELDARIKKLEEGD